MNLRIVGATTAALLLSLWCSEPDVRATSRTLGSIVETGQMIAARFDHAAVLLPNGRVLIVGGIERNGVMQPSAELFDPATRLFTATGRPLVQHGWGFLRLSFPTEKFSSPEAQRVASHPVIRHPLNFMIPWPRRLHPQAK